MYPSDEESAAVKAAEDLMLSTMARYDPSHDAFHVQRVRKTALQLARSISSTRQLDLLVVELAALLHDVLDKKYVSPEEAVEPYAFFTPFFQMLASDCGVDLIKDGRARTIARIVDNVSWSTEKRLRATGLLEDWHRDCIELHCVQDADRLDAIGAFGIMRCAAYSAVTNHPLHTPGNDPAHAASAVQHFHDKLLHIRERLKTEPGIRLAEKRYQLMLDFLQAVDEEYNVEHSY
ncbi:uncharacterized protein LAESUDRAFT_762719 [Laetiporus sulphureus 93-53]|uniref:HD/PDEase domain-containing protein n=1 Tax=Laetiporus sulphureus 93-53 TaxID=1314785 RepID=A0A165CD52_9APHY|nr:uncharacterized protein LAESUDRAFT_762719 [Laetiporus sulphureus 93-53]KZT02597.1 hypothetical protein LAESUDRAFT_762719 [Laetiporus sulphureus 93-53]